MRHCKPTGKTRGPCPGRVIDHVKPLCLGGADHPSNMQWLTAEQAKMKDRPLAGKLKDRLSSYSYYNSSGDKANAYVLSSALLLQLSKDRKMRTSLIIRASNGKTGGPSWSEHYFYHFDYMPDVSLFEEKRFAEYLSNASKELDQAVNTLVKVVVTDLAKQSQDSPPVRVKSNFFGQFEMVPFAAAEITNHPGSSVFRIDGKPGVVLLPFAQGIHVFRPTQFEKLPY
jgi:hypothetical protein